MDQSKFLELTPSQLETFTGIHRANWSRYLNGHLMSEATLNKAAKLLGMAPEDLLKAINARRDACRK